MRTVLINQARMTSTRLPGKIMLPVLGKPLLEYQIERLKRCTMVDEIVIATTTNSTDDVISKKTEAMGVSYFRGDEEDVLSRYFEAAKAFQADVIVRVTSDCPLIDPAVVDLVIGVFLEKPDRYQYVSNIQQRTFPRGMDTEVFSFETLKKVAKIAEEKRYREHVTAYIYQHPDEFSLGNVENRKNESRHRWTVDTQEDFELIGRILETIYIENPAFTMENILNLLAQHPEWVEINATIEQKEV